jgi:hypothetical protein
MGVADSRTLSPSPSSSTSSSSSSSAMGVYFGAGKYCSAMFSVPVPPEHVSYEVGRRLAYVYLHTFWSEGDLEHDEFWEVGA